MVQSCCVPMCKNRQKRGNNISFLTFPKNDAVKRKKWLAAVHLTEHDFLNNKDLRICSQHFRASDFIFGGNVKKLKTGAIPKRRKENNEKKAIFSSPDERKLETKSRTADQVRVASPVTSEVGLPNEKFLFDCSDALACLRCKHCRNFETNNLVDLRHHFKENHAHLEESCNSSSPNLKHINKDHDYCSFESVFVNRSIFFKCPYCPFLTKWKSDLNRHILLKHTDRSAIQRFECDQCPYKTQVKHQLNKHYRSVHGSRSEYKCDHCKFKTELKHTMERHISHNHTDILHPYLKDHDYCYLGLF